MNTSDEIRSPYEVLSSSEIKEKASQQLSEFINYLRKFRAVSANLEKNEIKTSVALLEHIATQLVTLIIDAIVETKGKHLSEVQLLLERLPQLQNEKQEKSVYAVDQTDNLSVILLKIQIQLLSPDSSLNNNDYISYLLDQNAISSDRKEDAFHDFFDNLNDTLFIFPMSSGTIFGTLLAEMMRRLGKPLHWKTVLPTFDTNVLDPNDIAPYNKIVILDDNVGEGVTIGNVKNQIRNITNKPVITGLDYKPLN